MPLFWLTSRHINPLAMWLCRCDHWPAWKPCLIDRIQAHQQQLTHTPPPLPQVRPRLYAHAATRSPLTRRHAAPKTPSRTAGSVCGGPCAPGVRRRGPLDPPLRTMPRPRRTSPWDGFARRCALGPPGNAVSSPVGPHIQAHQPTRCFARRCALSKPLHKPYPAPSSPFI